MLWEMCPDFIAALDQPAAPEPTATSVLHPVTALRWSDEPSGRPHCHDACRDALVHLLYVRDRLQRGRPLKPWARRFWEEAREKAPNGAFFTRTELTPELKDRLQEARRETVEMCRSWRSLVKEGQAKAEAEEQATSAH
jgi:hypothetical protein